MKYAFYYICFVFVIENYSEHLHDLNIIFWYLMAGESQYWTIIKIIIVMKDMAYRDSYERYIMKNTMAG